MTTPRTGRTMTPEKTIFLKATPDLYVLLDQLRRDKQRQTGQRVTLNSAVLELVLTHPRIAPRLPRPLPDE